MKRFGIVRPEILTEWEFFVWRHRGTGNLIFHVISYVLFISVIVWASLARNWWLLLLLPPSQYIGYLGHVLFEEGGARSKDLLSPMTALYLLKVFYLVIVGKYNPIVEEVGKKLKASSVQAE